MAPSPESDVSLTAVDCLMIHLHGAPEVSGSEVAAGDRFRAPRGSPSFKKMLVACTCVPRIDSSTAVGKECIQRKRDRAKDRWRYSSLSSIDGGGACCVSMVVDAKSGPKRNILVV